MAKIPCISCQSKSGKRRCPALDGLICPVCCGEKRLKEIRCPSDCRYLQNVPYQQIRAYESLKGTWIRDHYGEIFDKPGLFNTVTAVEKMIIAYDEQKEALDRHRFLKGLQFLRRSVSPIEHIEENTTNFENYLKKIMKPMEEHPEVRSHLIEAVDFLVRRMEKGIESEEKFEEYKSFLKGFFRKQGLNLREDVEIPEEEEPPGEDPAKRLIIPPH